MADYADRSTSTTAASPGLAVTSPICNCSFVDSLLLKDDNPSSSPHSESDMQQNITLYNYSNLLKLKQFMQ